MPIDRVDGTHGANAFALVERYIPDPLPATLPQAPWCAIGGDVVVTLKGGGTISYGPAVSPLRSVP